MMKKFKYLLLVFVVGAISCGKDTYDGPKETFKGAFIDKDTKEAFQTAMGNSGVRIRMMEYSWSDTPLPYDFNCMLDGTFNNTKVFKGRYGVEPQGAFVPLDEEIIDIKGTVNKTYEVDPLLRLEWVGEPVINNNGTATIQVKIKRGTNDPEYQDDVAEAWLYFCENMYVGDFNFNPSLSSRLFAGDIRLGEIHTITSGLPQGPLSESDIAAGKEPIKFPNYSRKFFIRVAARTTRQFGGVNRYNYTTIKEITTPNRD